jgi:fumarate reductase iron-sulfur subunit
MRRLNITIFRYDPSDPEDRPRYQEYLIDEQPRMSIFNALDFIQTQIDPSIYYDVVCRSNVCGSCAININGQPKLACRTQTSTLPNKIVLEPLTYFPLIKDLSTNKAFYFDNLNRSIEGWIHIDEPFNEELEHIVSEANADVVYEADRCIECGICLEACGAAKFNKNYLGATGINRVWRFAADSRDKRGVKEMLEYLQTEDGVFGCEAMLGCRDFCPKDIELPRIIGKLRNKVVRLVIANSLRNLFRVRR